ncbi:hypothetical protein B0I37DRAFT_74871 [Chaetomium sp. MPI-CAGE-AT-0009]|nr:hypothetical protein B0I37DRAFT_74871 [Chaetomium sp. MPI-CAGE-AT-0009]
MPPKPRRKACIACAESKRRCDQQLPECQRCIDRDLDCLYPQPRRRRRGDTTSVLPLPQTEAGPSPLPLPTLRSPGAPTVGLGAWPATGLGAGLGAGPDDDPLQPHIITPYELVPTTTPFSDPVFGSLPGSGGLASSVTGPWFLQAETWIKEHQQPHGSAGVELDPFIRAVDGMLQAWVTTGHNSFIHERLYGKVMAPCLQDAFTTLAAYTSCTLAVKETILQIAEDRSSTLARESLPNPVASDGGAPAVRGHLARVHALFTYIFIRLFDGSVRARAAAEGQLPVLRRWLTQLWNEMQQYRDGYHCSQDHPFQGTIPMTHDFGGGYDDAATELWQLWILAESVRRSLIIIETIANVYECMVRGWAECTGAVMFTARSGLWEAKSAVKWLELSSVQSPLLASSLCPERFISQYAAEEVDDFAKVVWGCAVGTDKMQCWIDRTAGASRVSVV